MNKRRRDPPRARQPIVGRWTIKKRIGGVWRVEREFYNIFTSYGLSAVAGAPNGGYVPPQYLAMNGSYTTLNASYGIGVSTVVTAAKPTIVGDTQIVLSAGLANQETVTFTGVSGTGPYTWTLSPATTKTHASGDPVSRMVNINDTAATGIVTALEYDHAAAPNTWPISAAGYQSSPGNWTVQFYFIATQVNAFVATAGLIDNPTFGSGNLHSHSVVGLDTRSSANDFEIDINLTYING